MGGDGGIQLDRASLFCQGWRQAFFVYKKRLTLAECQASKIVSRTQPGLSPDPIWTLTLPFQHTRKGRSM